MLLSCALTLFQMFPAMLSTKPRKTILFKALMQLIWSPVARTSLEKKQMNKVGERGLTQHE